MPKKSNRGVEVNPYHYILQCLGGKWKMTLAIRQMTDKGIPIDADNFVVHLSEKYVDSLREYIKEENLFQAAQRKRNTMNE
ncbi:hypothetical protein QMP26_14770 [Enterocloster clostridioformis]|uniref:hypothetical protein n=1 Tax=Enterocloster clostridioformis TaxID=1531 RepID=UPI001C3E588D|nr:hypothetical protein [Enterocloster clostridioformis]